MIKRFVRGVKALMSLRQSNQPNDCRRRGANVATLLSPVGREGSSHQNGVKCRKPLQKEQLQG